MISSSLPSQGFYFFVCDSVEMFLVSVLESSFHLNSLREVVLLMDSENGVRVFVVPFIFLGAILKLEAITHVHILLLYTYT